MPSRGMPTTYPAPPFEPEANGLNGPNPSIPVPCSSVIFSSSVISFTTMAARSSGKRLVFIHGSEDLLFGVRCAADCIVTEATNNSSQVPATNQPEAQQQRGRCIIILEEI